ncbi:hypothetical protein SPHINGO8BC_60278 [Sphingobacterium multivorum]|uniref:Uncharacterized protein n=1 Tax=Sphingobacterium multivorum TaxID=28454 RepID=A0A654DJR2_SPHMU|nr:hypothetical protein SPHINGO8BC_60278 [Sphingobacterium multivorum]
MDYQGSTTTGYTDFTPMCSADNEKGRYPEYHPQEMEDINNRFET